MREWYGGTNYRARDAEDEILPGQTRTVKSAVTLEHLQKMCDLFDVANDESWPMVWLYVQTSKGFWRNGGWVNNDPQ